MVEKTSVLFVLYEKGLQELDGGLLRVFPFLNQCLSTFFSPSFAQLQEIKRAAEGVWYPTFYPEHEKYTNREMIRRAGAQRVPVTYTERYQTRDISGLVDKAIENNKKDTVQH